MSNGSNGKSVLSVEIESDVREKLDEFRQRSGMKIQHIVNRAIRDYLSRNDHRPVPLEEWLEGSREITRSRKSVS